MFNNKGTLDTEGEWGRTWNPEPLGSISGREGRERKGGKREETVGTGEKKERNWFTSPSRTIGSRVWELIWGSHLRVTVEWSSPTMARSVLNSCLWFLQNNHVTHQLSTSTPNSVKDPYSFTCQSSFLMLVCHPYTDDLSIYPIIKCSCTLMPPSVYVDSSPNYLSSNPILDSFECPPPRSTSLFSIVFVSLCFNNKYNLFTYRWVSRG